MRIFHIIVLTLLLFAHGVISAISSSVYAAEEHTQILENPETGEARESIEDDENHIEQPEKNNNYFSILDTPHHSVSSGFESLARSIDAFFANEKGYYESTGSYLQLTADMLWEEAGRINYTGHVRVKLELPNTKTKLKLIIESDPDEGKSDIDRTLEGPLGKASDQKSYFAGAEAELGREDAWQIRPAIGVKVRSPLDIYARIRINRTYKYEIWSLHLNETLFWFDSSGGGLDSLADLHRPISKNVLVRSSSFAGWTEINDYFNLSQVFSISQKLSERRGISYQAGVYGLSQPTIFVTDYLLLLKYRQTIHSDYLFMEIIPQIRYQKINDFHAEHALLFRLEWVFRD